MLFNCVDHLTSALLNWQRMHFSYYYYIKFWVRTKNQDTATGAAKVMLRDRSLKTDLLKAVAWWILHITYASMDSKFL